MPLIKRWSADIAFSLCVRKRANFSCQRCGAGHAHNSQGLHCAHLFSRGNWSTRFDPRNAFSLDYGCHAWFGKNPLEFQEWASERLGGEVVEELRILSKTPAKGLKKHLKAIAAHFRDQFDRMDLGGEFQAWRE